MGEGRERRRAWISRGARDTLCTSAQHSPSLLPGGPVRCLAKSTTWEPHQARPGPLMGEQVHSRYLGPAGQPGSHPLRERAPCWHRRSDPTVSGGEQTACRELPGVQCCADRWYLLGAVSFWRRAPPCLPSLCGCGTRLRELLIPPHPVRGALGFSLSLQLALQTEERPPRPRSHNTHWCRVHLEGVHPTRTLTAADARWREGGKSPCVPAQVSG